MFAKTARMPLVLALILVIALALTACAKSPEKPDVVTPPADGGAASGSRLAAGLYDIEGGTVQAVGTRLDGASIRMAGPEIEIDSISEITDTPGAAD